jgi:hypothetical protein
MEQKMYGDLLWGEISKLDEFPICSDPLVLSTILG